MFFNKKNGRCETQFPQLFQLYINFFIYFSRNFSNFKHTAKKKKRKKAVVYITIPVLKEKTMQNVCHYKVVTMSSKFCYT